MQTYKKVFIGLWTVAGLLIIGSTINQLQKNSDNDTTDRLNAASQKITGHISSKKKLPENLQEAGVATVEGITYKKISDNAYELCATFKTSVPGRKTSDTSTEVYVYAHESGYQCFKAEPYLLKERTNSQGTDTFSSSGINIKTRDTERQTDIKTLHSQIEAYYAQNGKYPTLANMSNSTFRASNMKGLDSEALKDPSGAQTLLVSSPVKNYYSYAVTSSAGATCDNVKTECAQYTLTATLEAGGTYTKANLN